ncbi:hypothetical protein VYU27_000099 [Nannochloropsis oceanica]
MVGVTEEASVPQYVPTPSSSTSRRRFSPIKRYLVWLLSIILILPLLLAQGVQAAQANEDDSTAMECDADTLISSSSSSRSSTGSTTGSTTGTHRFFNRGKKRGGGGKHVLMVSINELSHIKPLTALARELLRRGHRVTFVAPESCLLSSGASASSNSIGEDGPPAAAPCQLDTRSWMTTYLPKATFLSAGPALTSAEKEAAAPRDLGRAVLYALQTVSDVNEALLTCLLDTYSPVPDSPGVKTTTAESDKMEKLPSPDMMVVDFLATAAMDAAEVLGVPLMVNNPFPICHDLTEPQGILVPVHAFPAPLRSLKTFKGRIANLINHILWLGVGLYAARLRNLARARHALPSLPTLEQLSFRASPVEARAWILQNTVFGLEVPRVIDPRTHMVGPLLIPQGGEACTAGKPERDCRAALKWLGRGSVSRPVVFVNLAEPLAPAPLVMVQAAIKALASDQIGGHFDVLWVLDEGSKVRLDRPVPPHMLVVSAVNPLAVLSHPRVVLSLSQPSLEAVSEALWHGVPVLGLPLRGYDRGACTLAQDAGAALCLLPTGRRGWGVPENLVGAIKELAPPSTPSSLPASKRYRENARRLAVVMQASGGVPRAADLVELGMRVGLSHLQQPKLEIGLGMGSSWLGGSMVDVRLVLFVILLLSYWTLTLGYRLLKRLHKWWRLAMAKEGGGGEDGGGKGVLMKRELSHLQQHHQPQPPFPSQNGLARSAASSIASSSRNAPLLPNPVMLSPCVSAPNMLAGEEGGNGRREGGGGGGGGGRGGVLARDDRVSPSYQYRASNSNGFGEEGGRGGGGAGGGSGTGPSRQRPPLPPRPQPPI